MSKHVAHRLQFMGNLDVFSDGKYLLEILSQLRHFGVGRLVTKQEWARRWPEQPSYLRVRRVVPKMDRWMRHGRVLGDWTHRGTNFGLFEFSRDIDRADWRLIHKDEETEFTQCDRPYKGPELCAKMPLTPVLQYEKMKRENTLSSQPLDQPLSCDTIDVLPSLDLEHEFLRESIKLVEPSAELKSIYDIQNKQALLDLYGEQLTTKVENWSTATNSEITDD